MKSNAMTVKEFINRFDEAQRTYLLDVTSNGLQTTGYDYVLSCTADMYSSTDLFVAGACSFLRFVLTKETMDVAIAPGMLNDFTTAFSKILTDQEVWYKERLEEETIDGEVAEEYESFFTDWKYEIEMLGSIVDVLKGSYHDAWIGLNRLML